MEGLIKYFAVVHTEAHKEKQSATARITRLCRRLGLGCFVAGFISPVLGLAFIVLHAIAARETILDEMGSALMFASIPLLLLGSHLMDLSER